MTFEVWTTLDGTQGATHYCQTYDEATAIADSLVDYYKRSAECYWEVFILPHYCNENDDECVCVQWLDDHRPYAADDRTMQRDYMQHGY